MENAADALKIAFALIIFAIAITFLFIMTSQTRETADFVFLHADDTNFHEYADSKEKNRVVTVSDVITTLYRYYKETISVTINFKNGKTATFDLEQESNRDVNVIEDKLGKFIKNNLTKYPNKKFTEEFIEVPTSGIYLTDSDGSEVTLSAGSKKIYITYEEK